MKFSFKNAEELNVYCLDTYCVKCRYLEHCKFGKADVEERDIYDADEIYKVLSRVKKLEKLLG